MNFDIVLKGTSQGINTEAPLRDCFRATNPLVMTLATIFSRFRRSSVVVASEFTGRHASSNKHHD
jgi:hypothetical protein